jgi:hypothetical protein
MRNYVIAGVGNYVIENPSNLGNYVIADSHGGAAANTTDLLLARFADPIVPDGS